MTNDATGRSPAPGARTTNLNKDKATVLSKTEDVIEQVGQVEEEEEKARHIPIIHIDFEDPLIADAFFMTDTKR